MSIINSWKAIGSSAIGSSHTVLGKPCEDALAHTIIKGDDGDVLICCVSDGAGSAQFASFASSYCTNRVLKGLSLLAQGNNTINEPAIYGILEDIYDKFAEEAELNEVGIEEYSCTLLGCYITPEKAIFFQVGDGAIVRKDATGFYVPVWMPHNGEYQNTTSFIIDDKCFSNLKISIIEGQVDEVALFTDGLQMLALNMEAGSVHQPFFTPLFKYLRLADDTGKIEVLQQKLMQYLDSETINSRTDDDKTLFLATRE